MRIAPSFRSSPWFDWLIAALLVTAALALRLPNLLQVPVFDDEGLEVLWGLDIAQGRIYPLNTGVNHYYGPLFPYLMATLFRMFGVHLEIPRMTVAITGALTVGLSYGLGRLLYDRWAGIIGAALALGCPALILESSHHGQSSSLAPFFVTAALTGLVSATERKNDWMFALSGLAAALAIQTHPTSGVVILGIALWWMTRKDLRTRSYVSGVLVTLAFFMLGMIPQAAIMLGNRFHNVSETITVTIDPGQYGLRLIGWLKVAGYQFAGEIAPATFVTRSYAIAVETIFITSVAVNWRLGRLLLPLVFASSALLLPIFIDTIQPRYFLYLFPVAFVCVGIAFSAAVPSIWTAASNLAVRRVAQGAILVLVALMIVIPMVSLFQYYDDAKAKGETNAVYFRLLQTLRQENACGTQLMIEDTPADYSSPASVQKWYALHAIDYLLTLEQCPHQLVTLDQIRHTAKSSTTWLITSEASAAMLAGDYRLERVTVIISPPITMPMAVTLARIGE